MCKILSPGHNTIGANQDAASNNYMWWDMGVKKGKEKSLIKKKMAEGS